MKYYTKDECAEKLNISRNQIQYLFQKTGIRAMQYTVGHCHRNLYAADEFQEWCKKYATLIRLAQEKNLAKQSLLKDDVTIIPTPIERIADSLERISAILEVFINPENVKELPEQTENEERCQD